MASSEKSVFVTAVPDSVGKAPGFHGAVARTMVEESRDL